MTNYDLGYWGTTDAEKPEKPKKVLRLKWRERVMLKLFSIIPWRYV